MARSIMTVMQENVNPVSVSNALYELMVEWRSIAIEQNQSPNTSRMKKLSSKRNWTENTIARFFGVEPKEMRVLLSEHFGVVVEKVNQ